MGYQAYAPGPGTPAAEPPEAQSIRSMLHIVRILAIIFGILILLGGLAYVAVAYAAYASCTAVAGQYCTGLGAVLAFPILLVIWGVVDFVIYIQMREIEGLVNRHQYDAAKSKTLIWMILGFIIGGIIVGILLLVAYLKFDPLISWQRNQAAGGPAYGAPPPMAGAPMAAAGAPPAGAGGQRFCSSCGSPNVASAAFCAKCGAPMNR